MSAAYTLHVAPYGAPGDPHALDRSDLVRDGFSWGAFLVPALWFIRHRHWLLALGAAALVAALAFALHAAGAGAGTILAAELHRGRPVVDVVYAANEAEAETKSFARWLSDRDGPEPRRPPAASRIAPPVRPGAEPVIGLFPDFEGRR